MIIYEELKYLRNLNLKALQETAQITLEIAKHNNHYQAAQLQKLYDELKELKSYELTVEHNYSIEQMIKVMTIINATGGNRNA